jgi:hypothetical protein
VKEQLNLLLQLQAVDRELAGVNRLLQAVPGRLEALAAAVAELEGRLKASHDDLDDVDKRRRSAETDVEDAEQKLRKYQGQLAEVKTNEQYQALLREISVLKDKVSAWEDEVLNCMEAADEGRDAQKRLQLELERGKQDASAKREELQREGEALREKAASLNGQRDDVAAQLPGELLAAYERIRKGKGGVALAAVEGETCSVCHGFIPPQHIAEVKKALEVFYCHNCGRILVWRDKGRPE